MQLARNPFNHTRPFHHTKWKWNFHPYLTYICGTQSSYSSLAHLYGTQVPIRPGSGSGCIVFLTPITLVHLRVTSFGEGYRLHWGTKRMTSPRMRKHARLLRTFRCSTVKERRGCGARSTNAPHPISIKEGRALNWGRGVKDGFFLLNKGLIA